MQAFLIDSQDKFRWNAGITVIASSNAGLALLLENRQFLIDDPLEIAIVQLTHLSISIEELVKLLKYCENRSAVHVCVTSLLHSQILVYDHSQQLTRNSLAFWDNNASLNTQESVSVLSLLPKFDTHLSSLLQANGVSVSPDGAVTVLATDDYRRPEIAGYASDIRRLVLAKPVGEQLWFGPYLRECEICWECLNYWLRLHAWAELSVTGLETVDRIPVTSVAWLPATTSASSALITQAVTLLASCVWPYENDLWIFDFHTFQARSFPITARRNCLKCKPSGSFISLIALQSCRTGIFEDEPIISDPIGPFYLTHAKALMPFAGPGVRSPVRPQPVDGKGTSVADALMRCTMEAVERYSSAFTGDEEMIYCCSTEIPAIVPDDLLLFSPSQLASRNEWNSQPGTMHGIPEAFDPSKPTHWVQARSLTGREDRFVPAGYAWLWYPFKDQPFYNFADTNGCAAGISLEDATLRALLELIEREALAIWWYNRLQRPGVPLDKMGVQEVDLAIDLFRRHDRTLELLDLTHDLGIAVYVALSADSEGKDVYFGCAANTCGLSAAKQSIAELIQFWYWGTRLGNGIDRRLWLEKSSTQSCPYLRAIGEAPLPAQSRHDGKTSIDLCLHAIKKAGLEAFAVDLTKPELGIPVVRCVVPGMRHYGPRFAPGRLFGVPKKMGWLAARLAESQMNPHPCIL